MVCGFGANLDAYPVTTTVTSSTSYTSLESHPQHTVWTTSPHLFATWVFLRIRSPSIEVRPTIEPKLSTRETKVSTTLVHNPVENIAL